MRAADPARDAGSVTEVNNRSGAGPTLTESACHAIMTAPTYRPDLHLIAEHEDGLEKLLNVLDQPKRAVDVFDALFKARISDGNLIMATGESIAHLNYLVALGDVVTDSSGDNLCARNDSWCDFIFTVVGVGDTECASPVVTMAADPSDAFNSNPVTFLNDTFRL